MDWLRGNKNFGIGHKAIPHLEYLGIFKLELFLHVAEKFLSGIGRITHSLGKPVKEKEVWKSNIGNVPKGRQLAYFSIFQCVNLAVTSTPHRYPRLSRHAAFEVYAAFARFPWPEKIGSISLPSG